jgi:DNA-binding transcriptional MerR regulator
VEGQGGSTMRIGELAARTGTTAKTLRFYEKSSLLPGPMRTLSGYRDYDEGAIARIQFVRAGQAIGLTLAEVRNLIDIRDDGASPCSAATDLLDRHLSTITKRIDELKNLKRDLAQLRVQAVGLDPADCPPESICQVINHRH